uniref:Uncharacterized protein n=1 Tax=Glossina pallidipes TaxID=7398 RepID=A0A1B0A9M2_GLOPL
MKKNLPREFLSNKPTTTTNGYNQRTNQPSSKNNARITTTSITAWDGSSGSSGRDCGAGVCSVLSLSQRYYLLFIVSGVVGFNSSQQLFGAAVTQRTKRNLEQAAVIFLGSSKSEMNGQYGRYAFFGIQFRYQLQRIKVSSLNLEAEVVYIDSIVKEQNNSTFIKTCSSSEGVYNFNTFHVRAFDSVHSHIKDKCLTKSWKTILKSYAFVSPFPSKCTIEQLTYNGATKLISNSREKQMKKRKT